MIVASMGASAIILFFIPGSPLAQPWPIIGGQMVSAIVGVYCALNITEPSTAAASAVGGSILMMLLMRCLHPPAAATSLTPIMAGTSITSLGYSFVIVPVGINVVIMLILAIVINRWVMGVDYPSPLPVKKKLNQQNAVAASIHQVGFSEQDLALALSNSDVFIDMTHAELSHLLTQVEKHAFKRLKGQILCADLMVKEVITVEYGTDVEEAWKIMQQHKLKAIPVIDKANRVIGIITWNDFFKFINLSSYDSLQDKFRAFIRRTPEVNANKPESIGHIMTKSVITLSEDTHIAELVPLMSTTGLRQIPIINEERRLVGMVYQSHLIAALYNQK